MFDYESEEEQIEAIKNWWKENGIMTVAAVALSLAGYFGYTHYKDGKIAEAQAASYLYDTVVKAADDEERAATLITELKTSHGSSQYAKFAAFKLAKDAVEKQDYKTAAQELQWVLDNAPDELTAAVAKLRLARVYYQTNKYDEALALVNDKAEGFEVSYLELQGDIYRELDKAAEAKAAYEEAIALLAANEQNERPYIQIKLDDLAVAN